MQSADLNFYEAEVMNDTAFGGGRITNIKVVDGLSNNLFPDTSDLDHALGRFQLRKIFGKGDTDDVATLGGAFAMIAKPPSDPLTVCTIFQTSGWADLRSAAVSLVERYLNKGTRMLCRIQDVHYTGSKLLTLYDIAPGRNFPDPGYTVVLLNPASQGGQEQYVRVLKTTISQTTVTLEGQPVLVNLCVCDLSNEIEFDVMGKTIQKDAPNVTTTATLYSTTPAAGVNFAGIKGLSVEAGIGGQEVTVADGIFSSIVPAATVENPVIDVYPLLRRPSLARTARAAFSPPAFSMSVGPGTVVLLPTASAPGTMVVAMSAATLTENAAGELIQGSTVVGKVIHTERKIEFLSSAPNYGAQALTLTYNPATITGAGTHSGSLEVTEANQGFGWVFAFEPIPGPGTLSISYMAQGRWYELYDNGTGKLAGADASYGTGNLSFTTGSLALTLGALPDVGSDIIMIWGDGSTAVGALGALPTRIRKRFTFTQAPVPGSIVFNWIRGGSGESASVTAAGVVTGPADVGTVERAADGTYSIWVAPHVWPDDGLITMSYQRKPEAGAFTESGGGTYMLTDLPVRPGSIRFKVIASTSYGSIAYPTKVFECYDNAAGVVLCQGQAIGTVNYTSGQMDITSPVVTKEMWTKVKKKVTDGGSAVIVSMG